MARPARSTGVSPFPLSMASDAVEVVRYPRVTDALGAALRNAFAAPPLPDEMAQLLRRLERTR